MVIISTGCVGLIQKNAKNYEDFVRTNDKKSIETCTLSIPSLRNISIYNTWMSNFSKEMGIREDYIAANIPLGAVLTLTKFAASSESRISAEQKITKICKTGKSKITIKLVESFLGIIPKDTPKRATNPTTLRLLSNPTIIPPTTSPQSELTRKTTLMKALLGPGELETCRMFAKLQGKDTEYEGLMAGLRMMRTIANDMTVPQSTTTAFTAPAISIA